MGRKGSVMVLGLIVMGVMLLFATTYFMFSSGNSKRTSQNTGFLKAKWLARSGISRTLWEYRKDFSGHKHQILKEALPEVEGTIRRGTLSLREGGSNDSLIVSLGIYAGTTAAMMLHTSFSHTPKDLRCLDFTYLTPDVGTQFLDKLQDYYSSNADSLDLPYADHTQIENMYAEMMTNKNRRIKLKKW
jgi:hypothetical protein